MGIAEALTMLSQATSIVKELRHIDTGFDAATLKAQMVSLYGLLADAKNALADAREVIHAKDTTIKELEAKIAALTSGEPCAMCSEGRLKIVASRPHEHFHFAGIQMRTLKCEKCGHSEERMYDPNGRTTGR